MPISWIDAATTDLTLPSGNSIKAREVDMMALVMSADNTAIPNGLLQQISAQMSGQSPDVELTCSAGLNLPTRGEPCSQGSVRGTVVDVTGTAAAYTVRVSMAAGSTFAPGEIRFGGMNVATVDAVGVWAWRIGGGNAEQARKELPEMGAFIDLIVRAASVSPKFVKEVTDPETQLPLERVSQADKMFIFAWAMPHEVRPAGTFPEGQTAGVAAAPDVQPIPSEPVG